MRTTCSLLLVALVLALIPACRRNDATKVIVRGIVTHRGTPLEGGMVVLVPDEDRGNDGPLVKGVIQPTGEFELFTDDQPGAKPGWYRVAVAGPTALASQANRMAQPSARYRNPELSGLLHHVIPGPVNILEINLED